MRISGTLRRTTLGDVLGALHREQATGALELSEEVLGRAHRLHLSGGLVQAVETDFEAPRVGEILRREGFISDLCARRLALQLAASPDRRAGELLVDGRVVTSEIVDAALRYQLRARLDLVFDVSDASIRFRVAQHRGRGSNIIPLSPHEFLHGRSRSRDKRRAAAPTPTPGPARSHPRASSVHATGGDPVRARALSALGLDSGADRDAVQRAFRRLASRCHPDRFPRATPNEKAELMRRFAEVSAAYHQLVA